MSTALNKSMETVKRMLDKSTTMRAAYAKPVEKDGPTGLGEKVAVPLKQPETLITDDEGIEMNPDLSEYE